MRVLVVVESSFGNTRRVGEAVCAAVNEVLHSAAAVSLVDISDAPTTLPSGLDALVVGAPTHNLGMSTPETREKAASQLGVLASRQGVREWLTQLEAPPTPPRTALFDTRTMSPWIAGSAAAQASALLAAKGFPSGIARESFRVEDVAGPLAPGELQRAYRWGTLFAERLHRSELARHP
jgi:hypothetical protein